MDKTLFQNISEGVERQQMLLDNADGVIKRVKSACPDIVVIEV